ncbi:MAG: hypothetical protein ABIO16_10045, partial [Nocardioides sp.]
MSTIDTRAKASATKRTHPINVGQFVMGIAFLGIVLVWILIEADAVTGGDIRWLLPVPWVLAGVAGLIATTRRHHDTEEWREAAYSAHERGWVGADPTPVVEEPYDDLDVKLARAERETIVQQATVAPEPADPADPVDPTDPVEPVDPVDPV